MNKKGGEQTFAPNHSYYEKKTIVLQFSSFQQFHQHT